MLALCIAAPSVSLAAESANFRLYDEAPNYAEPGTKDSLSENYRMREGGLTWFAVPFVGSTIHVNPAPGSSQGSASSSSVSSASSGGGGGGGGGGSTDERSEDSGGGRRGSGSSSGNDSTHQAASSSSSSLQATSSSASSQRSEPFVQVKIDPSINENIPSKPAQGALYPSGERTVTGIHYFMLVDDESRVRSSQDGSSSPSMVAGTATDALDCSRCPSSPVSLHSAPVSAPVAEKSRAILWVLAIIEFLALIRLTLLYTRRERDLLPGFAMAKSDGWSSTQLYRIIYGAGLVSDHGDS